MTLSAVAARYANALADVVTGSASALNPQQAVAELRAFEALLRESAELDNALVTPAIPGSRKKAVVGRLADVLKLSRVTRNFLFVLIDHRRIASLGDIIRTFEEVVDARLGFAQAQISSAAALSEIEQRAVTARLERLTGKRIRPRFTLDPSLIGGAVARIGSTVYDGSVRGQLAALERRLGAER
jgi:F-type H+-transporting ATPase subunit delta